MRNKYQNTFKEFVAALKCVVGKHHLPKKLAFPDEGMFIQGGICPRCGQIKIGKMLGNIDSLVEIRREGSFLLLSNGYYVFTSLATMRNLYEFYPDRYLSHLDRISKLSE